MIDHVFAFHMKCDHPPRKTKVPALPPIPIDSQNAIVALSSRHFDTYLKYSSVVVFQCCMNCCSFRVQQKKLQMTLFSHLWNQLQHTWHVCFLEENFSLSLSHLNNSIEVITMWQAVFFIFTVLCSCNLFHWNNSCICYIFIGYKAKEQFHKETDHTGPKTVKYQGISKWMWKTT